MSRLLKSTALRAESVHGHGGGGQQNASIPNGPADPRTQSTVVLISSPLICSKRIGVFQLGEMERGEGHQGILIELMNAFPSEYLQQ